MWDIGVSGGKGGIGGIGVGGGKGGIGVSGEKARGRGGPDKVIKLIIN